MIPRICAGAVLLIAAAIAQRPFSGTPEISHALERLANTGSVLMIAAHPDDENTNLLAYLARGRKVRTGYLSLTRGEGGQNLLGPETGRLLGVIRTQELLASRRIDGAEQFFTSAVDFGYSKSAEEALRIWGRDKTLGEIVWRIRSFRPDVIILQFSGTQRDGHGQHQASAILGKEAFAAAADQSRFPEQLKHAEPWQARRLVWNAYRRPDEPQLNIDTGRFDPVLGYSYAEIAGLGRSMHRSQAFGTPQRKGPVPAHIVHIAGTVARDDLLEGIGSAGVSEAAARARRSFDAGRPESVIPDLLAARADIERTPDRRLRQRKLAELDDAVALAAGLWLDAAAARPLGTPGADVSIELTALNRSTAAVELASIDFGEQTLTGGPLAANQPLTRMLTWRPANLDSPPMAVFTVKVNGAAIRFERRLLHRWVDERLGERTRDFTVVPPVSVAITQPAVVFPDESPRRVAVQIRAVAADLRGTVRLNAGPQWRVDPASHDFSIQQAGLQHTVHFDVVPPKAPATSDVTASAHVGGMETATTATPIDYPHIEPQTVLEPAVSRLVRAGVKVLSRNVGYVMGAGDEIPQALEQIGCRVKLLSDDDLAHGDLAQFDAIMTGVRAWNVRENLRANRARLFEYVRNGGTLVVQYNVLRPSPGDIAPWPLKIGQGRVSVEDAPVQILDAHSPLLRVPNQVVAADFAGWVQERGLYFAAEWTEPLRPAIASADPGEKPLAGGLLWARYGKGVYIFTAYSWFRQLPAGVPGAYRILANLVSAGKQ